MELSTITQPLSGEHMKHNLSITLFCVVFLALMNSCSSEEADPQFRILNERGTKANVQVQTSGGNTINLNDVLGGQTTGYQSAPEGAIVATAVIQNESVSPSVTFFAGKDSRSTIVVQAGTVPSLRVDRE